MQIIYWGAVCGKIFSLKYCDSIFKSASSLSRRESDEGGDEVVSWLISCEVELGIGVVALVVEFLPPASLSSLHL